MNSENKEAYIRELAQKYLQGDITPLERESFDTWYAEFDDSELRLTDSKFQGPEDMQASIYNRISAQIDQQPKARAKVYLLFRQMAAAAAVVLLVAGAYLYRLPLLDLVNPVKQVQVYCARGERKQVQLPDGTKVWLSPASTLTYPDNFRGDVRNISLNGDAFFDVVHDAEHPFVIRSGEVKTTVLGTSFNVNAYQEQDRINVTVVTGKVAVASKAKGRLEQVFVTANQRAIFNKGTSGISKEDFPEARQFIARREGLLEYKGTSLKDICLELEREYDIRIKLDQKLFAKVFYGNLNAREELKYTLNKLSTVMDLQWSKQGEAYMLNNRQ